MNLRSHQARMEAIETAFDQATSGLEKAQIVQLAASLDRDNFYAQQGSQGAGAALAQVQSGFEN